MRQITDSANQGKILLEKKYKATAKQLLVPQIYNWVQTFNVLNVMKGNRISNQRTVETQSRPWRVKKKADWGESGIAKT